MVANLVDTKDNTELGHVPYKIGGREGALTVPEAENRATAAAEKKIAHPTDGFGKKLSDYLSSL